MTDETTPTPEAESQDDDVKYEYLVGDKVHIPTHNGKFVAVVIHRYPSFEAASEAYQGSYQTILQQPYGKTKPDQPHYYCEVANSTRKPLGVAESAATLKWRDPAKVEAEA